MCPHESFLPGFPLSLNVWMWPCHGYNGYSAAATDNSFCPGDRGEVNCLLNVDNYCTANKRPLFHEAVLDNDIQSLQCHEMMWYHSIILILDPDDKTVECPIPKLMPLCRSDHISTLFFTSADRICHRFWFYTLIKPCWNSFPTWNICRTLQVLFFFPDNNFHCPEIQNMKL